MSRAKKASQWRVRLNQVDWYLCFGLLFLAVVLICLAAAGTKLYRLLNDAESLPIQAVAIKGERTYTSDSDIQQALQSLMRRSFFSADVTEVQQALEALPWVYRASVRREWPSRLKVYLQEQEPVAHWNGDAWLNVHGEVFAAPQQESLSALPQLEGPLDMAGEVLISYRQLSALLDINGFALNQLSLSPRHAWYAQLENGIVLDLGREDKMARIQRFINVYPHLQQAKKRVTRVDLRYDTGLAVGWDDAQHESR